MIRGTTTGIGSANLAAQYARAARRSTIARDRFGTGEEKVFGLRWEQAKSFQTRCAGRGFTALALGRENRSVEERPLLPIAQGAGSR